MTPFYLSMWQVAEAVCRQCKRSCRTADKSLTAVRALSDERFGRCGCKAAWLLRNRFWKRLHWFLRKTLGSCHTSGLAAWPLRLRRLSSLETAAAKPLGYVRQAFFRRRSRSSRQSSFLATSRSNGKSWTEAARPLLPCQASGLAATKLQWFISGQTARVTWQKRSWARG